MSKTIKVVGTLFVICIVAAACLALTNQVTAPIIKNRDIQANNELRQMVLPEAKEFKQIDAKGFKADKGGLTQEVYEGSNGGKVVGYTIKTQPSGYGGKFDMIIGISKDGKITGVDMANMQETAGLGAKAADEDFKGQYKGKGTDKDLVVAKGSAKGDNEILAISGATITSTATVNGVNAAIEVFNNSFK